MIRTKTIKELSRTGRRLYRARWRVLEQDPNTGAVVADEQGKASDPLTWGRWEEEYFLQVELARDALKRDPHGQLRPRGVIDQVPAAELWRVLKASTPPEQLSDYDEGKLRMLYALVGTPGRLACDVPDEEAS
jgi:hypothetical protein